jgi:hypothetical protein
LAPSGAGGYRGDVRILVSVVFAALLFMHAADAEARNVKWKAVEVRVAEDGPRVEQTLTKLLKNATRKAKWGKGDTVELSAKLTQLEWERRDDVLRVSVTVVARITGKPFARSRIRIGGRPADKRKIEKEALRIVSEGLITRLSDMARNGK